MSPSQNNDLQAYGYISAALAMIASATLSDWAYIAGIFGVFMTGFFQWRRDRRERLAFEVQMGIRKDRRGGA